jgi:pimeloyl-ACP methyl ester carboxylesterase
MLECLTIRWCYKIASYLLVLMRHKVTLTLVLIAAAYLVLCLLLFWLQGYLLFPGLGRKHEPLELPAGVRVQELSLADGTRYRTAVFDVEKPRGVLAYFVGNGEDLSSGVRWAANFGAYGLQTIVTEYPGYGESQGSPSFESIMACAERSGAEAQIWSKNKSVPLFVAGHSMGTFSAMHLAAAGTGDRLLLIAPPTSIAAAGSARYPFLPVALLLRHPFDNLGKAASIRLPTLVIHGDSDTIVPIEMGRELVAAIPGARMVVAPGQGHNSLQLHLGGRLGIEIARHFFQ